MTVIHAMPSGRQALPAGGALARHRHAQAYLALVLDGGYDEAGDLGRRRVAAGEAVVHGAFSAHANAVGRRGARVLNLALEVAPPEGFYRVDDLDALARLATRDARAAAAQAGAALRPLAADARDWPDRLAHDLRHAPTLGLAAWAAHHGLAPETLSRGFAKAFGVTPRQLRAELRAVHALRRVRELPLAALALDAGFADQAHMTHAITALSGRPPGFWRAQVK